MTVQERIATVPHWRHQIQLLDGVTTPGSQHTFAQLPTIGLPPDLSGLSVLDIGCSDGFYSFECERRGAARIVAVDNWSSVYIDNPSGFQVAHDILRSKVEFLKSDLFDLDPARIGQFDLVLFLGVLYHLRHPLLAIERLGLLCRSQLIVETDIVPPLRPAKVRLLNMIGIQLPDTWMQFYPNDEVNRDPTTWWAPTPACAEAMLNTSGFCAVKTAAISGSRGVFHAFSPQHGSDAEQLLARYGAEAVIAVCRDSLGVRIPADLIASTLRTLSIPDFGRIRQDLAELRAKQWHQNERWKAKSV